MASVARISAYDWHIGHRPDSRQRESSLIRTDEGECGLRLRRCSLFAGPPQTDRSSFAFLVRRHSPSRMNQSETIGTVVLILLPGPSSAGPSDTSPQARARQRGADSCVTRAVTSVFCAYRRSIRWPAYAPPDTVYRASTSRRRASSLSSEALLSGTLQRLLLNTRSD